jgi:hypothetical protein
MDAKSDPENLDEALANFSNDVKDMLKEENPLVESASQNVKSSVEQLESSIPEPEDVAFAAPDAQEKEAVLEEKVENLSNNIEYTMKNSPALLNKIKIMANKLMLKFGGSSEVMKKLDEKKASSLPLFMKKKFCSTLPSFINVLKSKNNNGSNNQLIEKLEAMNANLKSDVEEAKKKGFFNRAKESFSNFKNRFTWKRGGKRKIRGKKKTAKKRGGDDGEILLFLLSILWFVFLILCCTTGFGCPICGPLLVLSYCAIFGGQNCSASSSSSSNGMGSSSGVPAGVGTGIDALNTYTQARIDNPLDMKYKNTRAFQTLTESSVGGKRRSKNNKRKSAKKSRAHKK